MASPVVIKEFKITPVSEKGDIKKVTARGPIKRFQMLECEVTFDKDYFHYEALGELNYHNAYDADENFTLFRADAVFTNKGGDYVVPVFAKKDEERGDWKWFIRFRPLEVGLWRLRVLVLCWHPKPCSNEPDAAKRTSRRDDTTIYYEHTFGYGKQMDCSKKIGYAEDDYSNYPEASFSFNVVGGDLSGPLEAPDRKKGDNYHYFYRWAKVGGTYKRDPFFLYGMARPWNIPSGGGDLTDPTRQIYDSWESFITRETDLFVPMHDGGYNKTKPRDSAPMCNVLYHWMAPWETQLVHQDKSEYWPDASGFLQRAEKLKQGETKKGYMRYDQGRASLTDQIFNLADKYQVLIFLSVMSHQSLQTHPHFWEEWDWNDDDLRLRNKPQSFEEANGFQLFKPSATESSLKIEAFFEMDPTKTAASWKRRLWKHFANFWRYIIGRWTAHPALGAWILIDELEGIGTSSDWWWENKQITGHWHDNIVRLIRGELCWEPEGRKLPYTGDYLKHPLTTSTTHYKGTELCIATKEEANSKAGTSKNDPGEDAVKWIDQLGEKEDRGTWQGTPQAWLNPSQHAEKLDFLSHHAYQAVPTWGVWDGPAEKRRYEGGIKFSGWYLPNSQGLQHIDTNRWLWDSLCMRLHNWVQATEKDKNANEIYIWLPKLVTEYGCIERDEPVQPWDYYGPRNPSFTHLANWAALVLGHAGVPFKWNDGAHFGEMIGRASPKYSIRPRGVWETTHMYPVNNYAQMTPIANFIKDMPLNDLYPSEFFIIKKENDHEIRDPEFNAWALADFGQKMGPKTILVWIYDRTFTKAITPAEQRWLVIGNVGAVRTYSATWFDTWSGTEMAAKPDRVQSDAQSVLKIQLPPFPKTKILRSLHSDSQGAEGHDIALRLIVM